MIKQYWLLGVIILLGLLVLSSFSAPALALSGYQSLLAQIFVAPRSESVTVDNLELSGQLEVVDNSETIIFGGVTYTWPTTMPEQGQILKVGVNNNLYWDDVKVEPPSPFVCGDNLSYFGQIYATVEIGSQCWMRENLNVGIKIDGVAEQTDNNTIEKYCYDDEEASCDTDGGLYMFREAVRYPSDSVNGVQGICPDDWHIPTDDEWKMLEGTVDDEFEVGHLEWDGDLKWRGSDAGIKLYNDSSFGFYAQLGGLININNEGGVIERGATGAYWVATGGGGYRLITPVEVAGSEGTTQIWRASTQSDTNAFSVRCVKD